MSRAQTRSYSSLDRFIIPFALSPPDFKPLFGNNNPLTVEIGFGMGGATACIAAANPGKNYLGIEVFKAGIGRLLWEIKTCGLNNIRIIEHDAVDVVKTMLEKESVSAFHLFFPDPWPKKKHTKRRLLAKEFAAQLSAALVPGGYLYMTTDWEPYAAQALELLGAVDGMVNPFCGFAPRQMWRPLTKFERKGIEKQRAIKELYFIKEKTNNGG
jgi:tRNA (guanine-N7-)-methyltransferase